MSGQDGQDLQHLSDAIALKVFFRELEGRQHTSWHNHLSRHSTPHITCQRLYIGHSIYVYIHKIPQQSHPLTRQLLPSGLRMKPRSGQSSSRALLFCLSRLKRTETLASLPASTLLSLRSNMASNSSDS